MNHKNKKYASYGMHEVYLPTTGNGHKQKRDRRKCQYYIPSSKLCTKLSVSCVGPTLCQSYCEIHCSKNIDDFLGQSIYNNDYGNGVIISVYQNIYTIKFKNIIKQCKRKDICVSKGFYSIAKKYLY